GVAIGDQVLDVTAAVRARLLRGVGADACAGATSLNALMALGNGAASDLRAATSALLREDSAAAAAARDCLVPIAAAELLVPADVGDYTDFYASVHHATNVGSMFRPDNPLLPNYKYVPIGYHGRASSLVPSGAPVRRPSGQRKGPNDAAPTFGPSRSLDYECEVGAFVGPGNALGTTIPLADAPDHLFGLCLVNDWSARDVQSWEYQPLGPFLAKNFATTVSPWVVTAEALEPFRVPSYERPAGDPAPLEYLSDDADRRRGGVALTLEVWLTTRRMRQQGVPAVRLSRADFAGSMYWTLGQMIAHHASNGCNLRPGDLIASGTVSGPAKDARGCMLELTWRGAEPVTLPTGETRAFLEDGDEVVMRGRCEKEGAVAIGFGECRGEVV
ncbi:MAG TPA: fumarylacetoacetase, partial [Gemmatimonadaceae bacterium]|nr:fumarylacetoacetase [Gemmatimonadaceae bacterium]